MKFISELFEGGSNETQRKKRITFICICATLALIAIMLIILIIFGVASLVSANTETDSESSQSQFSIGETVATSLGEDALYLGDLLILDTTHRYKGIDSAVIIRNAQSRPKTQTGGNIYSILAAKTDEDSDLRATQEAVEAFNLMMKDFYTAKADDNICITKAYTKDTKETVNPVFTSGNALELGYYFDYSADPTDVRSIYGVEKYNWIYTNAYKYGFVNVKVSAIADDASGTSASSVFRYVGVAHATYIKTKKIDFDTYLEQLRNATPEAPLLIKIGKTTYASYFVSAVGEHRVPANYDYTVSGNNYDGYIITAIVNPAQTNKTQ